MTVAATTDDSEYSLSVDDVVERYAASTRLPQRSLVPRQRDFPVHETIVPGQEDCMSCVAGNKIDPPRTIRRPFKAAPLYRTVDGQYSDLKTLDIAQHSSDLATLIEGERGKCE